MKAYLIILLVLVTGSCQKDAYHYLKSRTYVECELVGFVARTSDSYPRYEQFRDETDNEALTALLSSKHLILRTYAYWALVEKLEDGYLEVFDHALRDTGEIGQKCGCTSRSTSIASSTYFNFWDSQVQFTEDSVFFSAPGKLYRLDSMIVHHPIQNEKLLEVVAHNGLYVQ